MLSTPSLLKNWGGSVSCICFSSSIFIKPYTAVRGQKTYHIARAPRSHRGGRGFESLRVHHIINPQKCGFSLCLCGFSSFLVFANLAVSCGLFAYRLHRNYTVKYPLQLRRGHLFTTPSLTLRVPCTKGAFALCLRLERPYR